MSGSPTVKYSIDKKTIFHITTADGTYQGFIVAKTMGAAKKAVCKQFDLLVWPDSWNIGTAELKP